MAASAQITYETSKLYEVLQMLLLKKGTDGYE
jgi:hypothetical protein